MFSIIYDTVAVMMFVVSFINLSWFFLLFFIAGFLLLRYSWIQFKRHQLDMENKNRELQDLNAVKDRFISVIAHDLKAPAANIVTLSNMIREGFDVLSREEQTGYMDMLVESTKTHYDLLNTLLDLSRMRLGSKQYSPERLDIRRLIHDVLEQTKLQAQQKHISQSNHADEDCFVWADKNMIAAVIRNLVVNGIKFTNPDGEIMVGAQKTEETVTVSVTDTGIGIVESKQENIFGVDGMKSTAGTANETGIGLGLLLCREYVERHAGTIWLESETGKGTTFFFTLPATL